MEHCERAKKVNLTFSIIIDIDIMEWTSLLRNVYFLSLFGPAVMVSAIEMIVCKFVSLWTILERLLCLVST